MSLKPRFFFLLFVLSIGLFSCSEKPNICECMGKSVDINAQLEDAHGDHDKIRAINERNEAEIGPCNEMIGSLSSSEKEEMKAEAKNCSNYGAFMELFRN